MRRPDITTPKFASLVDSIAQVKIRGETPDFKALFKESGYSEDSVADWERHFPSVWNTLWEEVNRRVLAKFKIERKSDLIQMAYKTAKDAPGAHTLNILQKVMAERDEEQTIDKDLADCTEPELDEIIRSEKAPDRFLEKVERE